MALTRGRKSIELPSPRDDKAIVKTLREWKRLLEDAIRATATTLSGVLMQDGSVPLTGAWDAGNFTITAGNFIDSGLTASKMVLSNGSKQLVSSTVTDTDLVWRDGSKALTSAWDAGNYPITCKGLTVWETSYPVIRGRRETTDTNSARTCIACLHKTTLEMADGAGDNVGFASAFAFEVQDATSGILVLGDVGACRSGADNTGMLYFRTYKAGVLSAIPDVSINPTGSLRVYVATGTAPFIVASTTVCTNLNADYVDLIHASTTATANYLLALDADKDLHLTTGDCSGAEANFTVLVMAGDGTDYVKLVYNTTSPYIAFKGALGVEQRITLDDSGLAGTSHFDVTADIVLPQTEYLLITNTVKLYNSTGVGGDGILGLCDGGTGSWIYVQAESTQFNFWQNDLATYAKMYMGEMHGFAEANIILTSGGTPYWLLNNGSVSVYLIAGGLDGTKIELRGTTAGGTQSIFLDPTTANHWDFTAPIVNSSTITGTQFISTIAIGTKPIDVTSTTVCTNLNADMCDGYSFNQALLIASSPTFVGLTLSGGILTGVNSNYIDVGVVNGRLLLNVPAAQEPRIAFQIAAGTAAVVLKLDSTGVVQYVPGGTYPCSFYEDAVSGVAPYLRICGYPTGAGSNLYASIAVARPTFNTVATNLIQFETSAGGFEFLDHIYINSSINVVLSTTGGTKFGTAATQLMSFWGAITAVQPAHVADAVMGTLDGLVYTTEYTMIQDGIDSCKIQLNALIARLETIGILAAA